MCNSNRKTRYYKCFWCFFLQFIMNIFRSNFSAISSILFRFFLVFIVMARRKKKEGNENTEHNSVKCALATIIKQDVQYQQRLIALISELSIQSTYIGVLGSLLFLYKVNILKLIQLFVQCTINPIVFYVYFRQIMLLMMKIVNFLLEMANQSSSIVSKRF